MTDTELKKITLISLDKKLDEVKNILTDILNLQPLNIKDFIVPGLLRCGSSVCYKEQNPNPVENILPGRYGRDRKVIRDGDSIFFVAVCEICGETLRVKLK